MAKVELNLSAKGVEVTNFILYHAMQSIKKDPALQKELMLSNTDLKAADTLRLKLKDLLVKRKL